MTKKASIQTKPGTIYFIRERDVITGEVSPYVKIGLTSAERKAVERADELSTGNPRELYVHHHAFVPCVSAVETALRYEFILQNVNLEWHYFGPNSPKKLDDAIKRCDEIAAVFSTYTDVIDAANGLASVESTGSQVAPSTEARDWQHHYLIHDYVVRLCAEVRTTQATESKAAVKRGEPAPVGTEVIERPTTKFDQNLFKSRFPEIYNAFVERKIVSRFRIVGELTPEEIAESPLVQQVKMAAQTYFVLFELRDGADESMHALAQARLQVDQLSKFSEMEREIARCHLQVQCGNSPGIEELCSWKRTAKDDLNVQALKVAHLDLWRECSTTTSTSAAVMTRSAGKSAGTELVQQ